MLSTHRLWPCPHFTPKPHPSSASSPMTPPMLCLFLPQPSTTRFSPPPPPVTHPSGRRGAERSEQWAGGPLGRGQRGASGDWWREPQSRGWRGAGRRRSGGSERSKQRAGGLGGGGRVGGEGPQGTRPSGIRALEQRGGGAPVSKNKSQHLWVKMNIFPTWVTKEGT